MSNMKPIEVPGTPRVISDSENFVVQIPMPHMPCWRCRNDMTGKAAYVANPHPSTDQNGKPCTAYHLVCEDCK